MEQLFNLIVFILSGYGFSNIIANSDISERVKIKIKNDFLRDLLDCIMCTGFWVGLILGAFFGFNPLVGAMVISGTSCIIQSFVHK